MALTGRFGRILCWNVGTLGGTRRAGKIGQNAYRRSGWYRRSVNNAWHANVPKFIGGIFEGTQSGVSLFQRAAVRHISYEYTMHPLRTLWSVPRYCSTGQHLPAATPITPLRRKSHDTRMYSTNLHMAQYGTVRYATWYTFTFPRFHPLDPYQRALLGSFVSTKGRVVTSIGYSYL